MVWQIFWQVVMGLCAGAFVAAGLFTFIVSLGIVTRLAQVTRTAAYIHYFENSFIAGGIVGNLFWLYHRTIPLGNVGLGLLGLFGGIFTGCLVGAVAEIVNAFPIFFRRLDLKVGTTMVVGALALGKLVGVLCSYFF